MNDATDPDYVRGHALLEGFIRGDADIGLIADVPGTERAMLDALWAAAHRGSAEAYCDLGDSYGASMRPVGAFFGVDIEDAASRSWSAEAEAIIDGEPALQAALRCYFEAGRRGKRAAVLHLAKLARHADEVSRRIAVAELERLEHPTPAEIYQRGLVQNWLGDMEVSAKSHLEAAEAGSHDAEFELYIYYTQGIGLDADTEKARAWLERAAEGEHPRALYNLGALWGSGDAGAVDFGKAATYYERAAAAGNARASASLGIMILTGELEGTKERAAEWLDQADEGGVDTADLLAWRDLEDPRPRSADDAEDDDADEDDDEVDAEEDSDDADEDDAQAVGESPN